MAVFKKTIPANVVVTMVRPGKKLFSDEEIALGLLQSEQNLNVPAVAISREVETADMKMVTRVHFLFPSTMDDEEETDGQDSDKD